MPRGKIEEQSKNPFQNTSTFMYISSRFIVKRHLLSFKAGPVEMALTISLWLRTRVTPMNCHIWKHVPEKVARGGREGLSPPGM